MANYREFISKRECLVNAVLWSVIPALQIGLLLFFPDRHIESNRGFAE